VSTRSAVRQALVDLWTPLFPNARVLRGGRYLTSTSELVVVGEAVGVTEPITLGPTRQLEETYSIQCTISVTWNGSVDQQVAVEDRAEDMFTAAELAVRSSPGQNLGVPGVLWVVITGDWTAKDGDATDTNGQINSQIEFIAAVKARNRLSL
jgi:hypothetical protein